MEPRAPRRDVDSRPRALRRRAHCRDRAPRRGAAPAHERDVPRRHGVEAVPAVEHPVRRRGHRRLRHHSSDRSPSEDDDHPRRAGSSAASTPRCSRRCTSRSRSSKGDRSSSPSSTSRWGSGCDVAPEPGGRRAARRAGEGGRAGRGARHRLHARRAATSSRARSSSSRPGGAGGPTSCSSTRSASRSTSAATSRSTATTGRRRRTCTPRATSSASRRWRRRRWSRRASPCATRFGFTYKRQVAHLLPYGIYTIPEVSCVGLSEEDAKSKAIDVRRRPRVLPRQRAREDHRRQGRRHQARVRARSHASSSGATASATARAELVHIGQALITLGGHRRDVHRDGLQLPDALRDVQVRRVRRARALQETLTSRFPVGMLRSLSGLRTRGRGTKPKSAGGGPARCAPCISSISALRSRRSRLRGRVVSSGPRGRTLRRSAPAR